MRIAIDPNVRKAGGYTYSSYGDVFGDADSLRYGDVVTVMCEETDLIGEAVFVGRKRGRYTTLVYLAVDWSSLRPDDDFSEINTTVAEFDAMWDRAIPVDKMPGSRTFGSGVSLQMTWP